MDSTLNEGDPTPEPIVQAVVDSFTCLSNSFNSNTESQENNILLARNHLADATFLCYEVITFAIGTEISAVCEDPQIAKYCIDMDYSEFKRKHVEFINLGKTAERLEREKLDASCIKAINAYKEAIKLGQELQGRINWTKIEDFERETSLKNQIIEALHSQKSSIIAAVILLILGAIITEIAHIVVPGAVGHLINATGLGKYI